MSMAKTSLNNNYGFPLDRGVIVPRPAGLTEEQYLIVALKEGHELLAKEAKPASKAAGKGATAKSDSVTPEPSKVQDALAQKSDNPYIRARATLLTRMSPSERSVIEKMIDGTLTKDARYDTFVKAVAELGDKISNIKL